ncbi:L-galactose dehydrogenase [Morella rubra]|uniref:L-galactose dehydrogenase n=1 Tax=Morella rubra TaxID=262757 RepID=A0A6A1VGJ6_9ROSI|nr:L-galactose dehydrogenase [Morella rubra]
MVLEFSSNGAVCETFWLGINFFDTSPYYGMTLPEKVLGKALKVLGASRQDYIVSTKCGRYIEGFDFSAERVTRSIDKSLARLQLDYVDILQCHDIEFGSLDQDVNETIPTLRKLKEVGKIRFIGVIGLPLEVFTFVLDRVPPGTVDVILSYCHYSINDSTLEDLLPYLKSKGVGIITASPLAMGLLTGVVPPDWHPASSELKVFYSLDNEKRARMAKEVAKFSSYVRQLVMQKAELIHQLKSQGCLGIEEDIYVSKEEDFNWSFLIVLYLNILVGPLLIVILY